MWGPFGGAETYGVGFPFPQELALAQLDLSPTLDTAHPDCLQHLQRALTCRDVESPGHLERVAGYAAIVADRVGLDTKLVADASRLHDIGKLSLPDELLSKRGLLLPWERLQMERHTIAGHRILSGSPEPLVEAAAMVALTHHERWDGGGYPGGLSGAAIPVEGRVVAIADAFDALTTDRPYRPALDPDEALSLMRPERGRQFDPALLDAFFAGRRELFEVCTLFQGL